MHATNLKLLLLVTAFAEGAAGLCLLVLPDVLLAVLLGVQQPTVDAVFVGRIAGTALLAIGVASGMARNDTGTEAQRGLLVGLLIYNAVVALLLAYSGAVLAMNGILLWPTAALHALLAAWCSRCLWPGRIVEEHP